MGHAAGHPGAGQRERRGGGRLVKGTAEKDYEGKDVHGKLVLTSSQPEAVRTLAIDRFGAAGVVSYAQNQVTGWWKEDETYAVWGHFEHSPPPRTFASWCP